MNNLYVNVNVNMQVDLHVNLNVNCNICKILVTNMTYAHTDVTSRPNAICPTPVRQLKKCFKGNGYTIKGDENCVFVFLLGRTSLNRSGNIHET